MHIAAANPTSVSEKDLDIDIINKEKKILFDQAKDSGKPENIIENMVNGRIKKYFEEVTLVNQKFVLNPDLTVKQASEQEGVEVLSFIRLEVGEGIDKKQEDFAEEVKNHKGGFVLEGEFSQDRFDTLLLEICKNNQLEKFKQGMLGLEKQEYFFSRFRFIADIVEERINE